MKKTNKKSVYPLISVIVPVFNGERFLKASLDSLFAQTYPNLEIIVINDGSTDDSVKILRQYPIDVFLTQANQGPSSARNLGIKASQGEFISFLDADDTYPVDKLERQYNLLKGNKEIDLIRGLVQFQFEAKCENHYEEQFLGNHLKTKFGPNVGSLLLRKKVFKEIGLFDKSIPTCEDIDFWRRIIFYKIPYFDQLEISLHYRMHDKNLILNSYKMKRGFIQFCKNEISRKKADHKKKVILQKLLLALKDNKTITAEALLEIESYSPTEFAENFSYLLPFLREKNPTSFPLLDKRAIGMGRKNWVLFNKISHTLSPLFQWLNTQSFSYCYLGALVLANYYTKNYFRSCKVHHFHIDVTGKNLVFDRLKHSFSKTFTIQKNGFMIQELNLSIRFFFKENHPLLQSQKLQKIKHKNSDTYFTTLKPIPYLRHLLKSNPNHLQTLVLMDIAVLLRHLKTNQHQSFTSQDLSLIQWGEKAIQLAALPPIPYKAKTIAPLKPIPSLHCSPAQSINLKQKIKKKIKKWCKIALRNYL